MKKSLTILLLAACGGLLYAQGPAEKAAADKKAPAVETSTAAKKAAKPEAAKTAAAAKQADQESEESVVMIDSKGETDNEDNGRAYGADQEEASVPGGLPSSYGQCKGVVVEAGRTLLVFESPDDGAISFVQVVLGKSSLSWKLAYRIPRSAD